MHFQAQYIRLTLPYIYDKLPQKAGIAQLVERGPEKPGVPSATLGPGTILVLICPRLCAFGKLLRSGGSFFICEYARVAQLVEQALRKR